jgi:hypothetical protein
MTIPSSAGAPAAASRRCPGCTTRIPLAQFVCGHCWDRLPYAMRQGLQTTRGRDERGHLAATTAARHWLAEHPAPAEPATPLATQLQDLADMLAGIGRHTGHSRAELGGVVRCSCGVAVTRSTP